jgi:stage II sporulation protein D
MEARANPNGALTVVNVVGLEDYLRGVVPNELSPNLFPDIEAHKAQAVAARTYALRNRGKFASRGYDICATAACQVYRGHSSEQPLSDEAVEATRGIVALYGGAPINAFYSSTCGGHTEDAENIFGGAGAPYLKGVACVPERGAWGVIQSLAMPLELDEGAEADLSRDVALLEALGIVAQGTAEAKALRAIPADEELRAWTSGLLAALHREGCESQVEPPLVRRAGFADHLVQSLCWQERGRRLLAPGDPEYLLQVEDRGQLGKGDERLAAATLIFEGILSPSQDGKLRPNAVLSRGEAVGLLARTALRAEAPGLVRARFRGLDRATLQVWRGDEEEAYEIDPSVRLFRALDGVPAATSRLTIVAGDVLSYVLEDSRVVYLQAEQSRLGIAADRASRFYRWEVRLTPAQLAQNLARYGSVGTVKDVAPLRLGSSGRVIELAVRGSDGELVLEGLEVRRGLGLRENLFVIERETDASGTVERFVFTGKGWGHGVGLCQVGAYGMAQGGSSYEEILKHYYTGISLGTIAEDPSPH